VRARCAHDSLLGYLDKSFVLLADVRKLSWFWWSLVRDNVVRFASMPVHWANMFFHPPPNIVSPLEYLEKTFQLSYFQE